VCLIVAAPEEILSAESSELLAAGVCVLWFSLFAAAVPLLSILCERESAGMQFQSARVYIRVLCDRQIFIQKSCYITQFAGIHVSHGWRLDGCAREQVDKREREKRREPKQLGKNLIYKRRDARDIDSYIDPSKPTNPPSL
jgi:hypothetical protein